MPLLVLLLAFTSASASAAHVVPERPKVEYARVDGKDCLQPIVRAADAVLKDYRDAQLRWLESAYPDSRAPFVQNLLRLPPRKETDPPGTQRVVHVSDKVTVVLTAGETLDVCFDVNLETLGPIE